MTEIPPGSIHVVITSPAYWNLKDYGNDDKSKRYEDYMAMLRSVFCEIFRVLIPGRFFCLNIGTALHDDRMMHVPSDCMKMLAEIGFILKREIIWNKPKGVQGLWQDYTTKFLKTTPYPCYLNVNVVHEFIHVYQKPGDCGVSFTAENKLSEEFIKEVCWSVWTMPVSYQKGHPAPFPYELARRLILCYSLKNERVLDPFGGSGTTMKAARDLNRDAIIYEINKGYVDMIKSNVGFSLQSLEHPIRYFVKIRDDCVNGKTVTVKRMTRKKSGKKGLDIFIQ